MVSAHEAFSRWKAELSEVSESPELELRELVIHFAGIPREKLLAGDAMLTEVAIERIDQAVSRRTSGEPLQYLLGEWDFFGRTYAVGPGVLIPRADTETLCEAALREAGGRRGLRILDLCAGSGCIAVTLHKELPDATVYALEKSSEALCYLHKNAQALQAPITVLAEDALHPETMPEALDMIVSNPPYLSGEDLTHLQKEVSYEPRMALDGGEDGLDFYRALIPLWKKALKPGGWMGFEIGIHQEEDVKKIFLKNNCSDICFYRDLCGIIRVVSGRAPQ